jgi:hypothetical protein
MVPTSINSVSDTPSYLIGTIIAAIWPSDKAQPGWLFFDGTTVSAADYPALCNFLYQNTYLPDLRGRYLWGANSILTLQQYWSRTAGFGMMPPQEVTNEDNMITLTQGNIPSHQHYGWGDNDGDWPYGTDWTQSVLGAADSDSGQPMYGSTYWGGDPNNGDVTVPFSIFQPSYGVNYFIFSGPKAD